MSSGEGSNPSSPKQHSPLTSSAGNLPKASLTLPIVWAVAVATIGSSFIFGYSIGAVNAPQQFIQEWMSESHNETFGEPLDDKQMMIVFPAAVSIFSFAAMIGAMISGMLANKFGRKGTLHLNNIFSILGCLFMLGAYWIGFYPLFHVGRFIIGLNAGIGSSVVPMFITEIAPVNWRGALGTLPQLLVCISILISQIFGLKEILGTVELWPYIFAVPLVPSVLQIIALFFVPESPKYTLVIKGDEEKATRDLCTYRNLDANDSIIIKEIKAVNKEAEAFKTEPKIRVFDLFRGALLWPTFLACFLQASQQLSGINAAMFYSTSIFKEAGLKDEWPIYATLAMGAANAIQTAVSFWLVEHPKFGRRSLLLIGTIGMFIATVALTISMSLTPKDVVLDNSTALAIPPLPEATSLWNSTGTTDDSLISSIELIESSTESAESSESWLPNLSIGFVLLFVISFATGPGSIPFFYVNEVFASNARASASALATGSNWICNFAVSLGFIPLVAAMGPFVFLIFSGFLFISVIFIVLWLPETKGKSLEQVEVEMLKRKPKCCCS